MFGGTGVAMPAGDNEPDPAKDIRLVPRGGHGGGRQSRQAFWVWPLRPPGPVAFVCEWPSYGIPESRVGSRPVRSALRHPKPLRSGLRPGNNGGCRVGRVVIRAQDEAEKRAGDRETLPLSETRASAHRESGRSELVPRERLARHAGSRTVAVRPGLVRMLFADPLADQRPPQDPRAVDFQLSITKEPP